MVALQPRAKGICFWCVIGCLCFAATVYRVRKERHSRIDNKDTHSIDKVFQVF